MTDEHPGARPLQSYDFARDPDGFTREDMLPADTILDAFLSAILGHEDTDASVGITLSLGGSLISGMAIPRGRWQRLWFESMREVARELTDAIEPQFDRQLRATAVLFAERDAKNLPNPALKFVHLHNATLWQGGRPFQSPLWRARLDRLDGWTLGTLQP